MKIAVINFSGNVGKTTIARHLLLPRVKGAKLVAIESINADDSQGQSLRGRQFGELQEYLQTVDSVVVDIGASNVEDLLALMQKYRGSHEDFDYFVVPSVPTIKQQQDTIATLVELSRIGVPASRIRIVFNMVENSVGVEQAFDLLLRFLKEKPLASFSTRCCVGGNEIYGRIRYSAPATSLQLTQLAVDDTDYKAMIIAAKDVGEKLALAQRLATRRLACGVVPELDACFDALGLEPVAA